MPRAKKKEDDMDVLDRDPPEEVENKPRVPERKPNPFPEDEDLKPVKIDWESAVDWGKRQKLALTGKRERDEVIINDARKGWGVPPYDFISPAST